MPHDFKFNFTLQDAHNEQTTVSYQGKGYLGATLALSFGEAYTDMLNLVNDLDLVTGARVVNATLEVQMMSDFVTNATLKGAPLAGTDVTDIAQYSVFLVTDGGYNKRAVVNIPAPITDLFIDATVSRDLDITEGALHNFLDNFVASAGGEPQISDGENIDTSKGVNGIYEATWVSRARRSRA